MDDDGNERLRGRRARFSRHGNAFRDSWRLNRSTPEREDQGQLRLLEHDYLSHAGGALTGALSADSSRMRAALAAIVFATVAGCSASSGSPPPAPPPMSSARPPGAAPPAAVGPADWPTYHHDNARTGVAGQLAPLGMLRRAWQA